MKRIVTTILKSVLFFIGWAIVCTFIPLLNTENAALWRLWAEITPLLSIIAFTIVFWLIEKKQVLPVNKVAKSLLSKNAFDPVI